MATLYAEELAIQTTCADSCGPVLVNIPVCISHKSVLHPV